MYLAHYGFREPPFSVTPNPKFLYSNPAYEEAFANLRYGIEGRKGFIVLTGEVGTGKTTLLRRLMATLHPRTPFVFLFNTRLGFDEILAFICDELRIAPVPTLRVQRIQVLNEFLLRQVRDGRTTALLIDEAQNLGDDVLEELRLLSNLETNDEKLLQIALVGQPELDAKLARQELRQLRQRIAVRCHLDRLKTSEIEPFIEARLAVAGYRGARLFAPDAVLAIARLSRGVPRLVNIICDNALLIGFAAARRTVTEAMILEAAADLELVPAQATGGFTPLTLDHAFRDVEEEMRARREEQSPPRAPKRPSPAVLAERMARRTMQSWRDGAKLRQTSAVVLLLAAAAGAALVARKSLDWPMLEAAVLRSQQQIADAIAAPVAAMNDAPAAPAVDVPPVPAIEGSAVGILAEEPSLPAPGAPSPDRVVAPPNEAPPPIESIAAPRREQRRARPRRRAKPAPKRVAEQVSLIIWSEKDDMSPSLEATNVGKVASRGEVVPRRENEWRCGAADAGAHTSQRVNALGEPPSYGTAARTFSNPGFSTGEFGW